MLTIGPATKNIGQISTTYKIFELLIMTRDQSLARCFFNWYKKNRNVQYFPNISFILFAPLFHYFNFPDVSCTLTCAPQTPLFQELEEKMNHPHRKSSEVPCTL